MSPPGGGRPARAGFTLWFGVLRAPEIAVSVAGLPARAGTEWETTQDAAAWVRAQRVRGIALDASRSDCRARDLGRSARRDLAAMLRRTELELTGIDLFIPPEHFTDPARADRAVETVRLTATMAAELARLVGGRSRALVSVTLPPGLSGSVRAEMGVHADRHGAVIADHTPGDAPATTGVGVGVDPAACFLAGADPVRAVAAGGLAALRLSDLNATGRCAVNAEGGRLDLLAYAAATITTDQRWITADTRGTADADRAVRAGVAAWREATMLPNA